MIVFYYFAFRSRAETVTNARGDRTTAAAEESRRPAPVDNAIDDNFDGNR